MTIEQPSLFGAAPASDGGGAASYRILRFQPTFAQWQIAARQALADELAPECAWFEPDPAAPALSESPPTASATRVQRSFLDLARAASCHRAADRWSLLFRMLWRLAHGERSLVSLAGDPDTARLNRYAAAVRRDAHKMKAFVRFRAVPEPEPTALQSSAPRFVAWFEPDHHILEYVSGFFKRRFYGMRWSILTPAASLHWEGGGEPWLGPGTSRDAGPDADHWEDAWRAYYASIFNPARVKVQAMLSEMPQKYWKNLPEAQLIPELLRASDQRVEAMTTAHKSADALQCGPTPAAPSELLARLASDPARPPLGRLRDQALACTRCPLAGPATQTVFGSGPADAAIMIIGEQPGDQEDLQGEPFVGPAGTLLRTVLADVALDPAALYLTNTVKHFKHRVQGRRRLHERPGAQEIFACSDWLAAEIALVQPRVIVCLGATAAQAQLGQSLPVGKQRGRVLVVDARRYVVSWHPAHILRTPNGATRRQLTGQLAQDLALARDCASEPASGL